MVLDINAHNQESGVRNQESGISTPEVSHDVDIVVYAFLQIAAHESRHVRTQAFGFSRGVIDEPTDEASVDTGGGRRSLIFQHALSI